MVDASSIKIKAHYSPAKETTMHPIFKPRRLALATLLVAAMSPWAAMAQSQPIKILVGFPAGGSADISARVIADKMKDTLGVPVIVENRPGAGGRIAAQAVREAAADGNTLMLAPFAVMVVQPVVFKSVKYDTTKDFTPMGNVVTFPLALAAGPSTPAKNMTELVTWLKANPAQANYGSPAAGSLPHFLGEMLAANAGVKMTHVPFQGGAPMVQNLLGGQIPIAFDTPAEFAEQHRAGKLRVLAMSGSTRSAQFPEVPTMKEQGVNLEANAWFALFGPANMPAAATQRISAALQAALKQPDAAERLQKLGLTAAPGSSDEMVKRLAADKAAWEPVIKNTGFQAE
jgi:tripartite-type tricarboxylate transporter receptor subunit TctC